jgi:glycine betaine/choline ABC-type transport system substrate-binding protein
VWPAPLFDGVLVIIQEMQASNPAFRVLLSNVNALLNDVRFSQINYRSSSARAIAMYLEAVFSINFDPLS